MLGARPDRSSVCASRIPAIAEPQRADAAAIVKSGRMTAAGLRVVLVVLAAVFIARTAAASLSVQGQVSTWFTLNDADPRRQASACGMSGLSFEHQLPESRLVDGEISINAFGFGESPGWDDLDTTGRLRIAGGAGSRHHGSRRSGFRRSISVRLLSAAALVRQRRRAIHCRSPGRLRALVREYFPRNFTVWAWGLWETNT
jgi:hypothetical protein